MTLGKKCNASLCMKSAFVKQMDTFDHLCQIVVKVATFYASKPEIKCHAKPLWEYVGGNTFIKVKV